jgi:hypothetical protein
MDERQEKRISLRLPSALHAALVTLADGDRRSLNSELIALLEHVVKQRETEAPAATE